jgi:hypothetical protein
MRKPRTGYEIKKDATTKALRALIASNGREEYQIHCAIVEMIHRSKLPGRCVLAHRKRTQAGLCATVGICSDGRAGRRL